MRLVSWNCCGGYAKKHSAIMALQPDIAILQEVRAADMPLLKTAGSVVWAGSEGGKGLAVVGLNGWVIEQHAPVTERWFIPVTASHSDMSVNVVGVWAAQADGYVAPAIRAVESIRPFVRSSPCLVAGDFNANVLWDKGRSTGRHFAELLRVLGELGLMSAYHHARQEAPGQEAEATIFHMWSEAKPYHIDYAFASADLLAALAMVRVGTYQDWVAARISDHVPLTAEFDLAVAGPRPV